MRRILPLLLFTAFVGVLSAQEMTLRSALQIAGPPGKGLKNPASFTYDPHRERILIANTGANTVDVFTAGGEFLFRIGETELLAAPVGVAALSTGRIVILQEKNAIQKIYDEGNQHLETFNLAAVDSVAKTRISRIYADDKDNLYLLDVGNNRILVLDKNWKKSVSAAAKGRGRPRQPVDLAAEAAGKIYLADEGDCPIRVFDPKGKFLSCLEKLLPGKDSHWRPAGICVDSKNRIWAIDADAAALRIFDVNGNLLQTIDSADEGRRKFFFPLQVSVDRYGRLYLLEKGENSIEVFQIENY